MNVVLERKRKRIGKPVAMMQRAKGTFSRKSDKYAVARCARVGVNGLVEVQKERQKNALEWSISGESGRYAGREKLIQLRAKRHW